MQKLRSKVTGQSSVSVLASTFHFHKVHAVCYLRFKCDCVFG